MWLVVVAAGCVLAAGFFSSADAALANVSKVRAEELLEEGRPGARRLAAIAADPARHLNTALFMRLLFEIVAIVLVAEVKDHDTAKNAVDPGIQGPLLYIQQPLPSISDQIRDWVKKVGDVKDATKALRAVTNQRLLRSLCPNCRQAYQPTPEQLRKLNLPAKKVSQLYRASGKVQVKNKIEDCPICKGTGYLGQTAAFEVFIVDDEARKLLAAGDLKAALSHARRNNMFYLQEAALSKVIAGETTLEEVVRVTAPTGSGSAGGGTGTSAGKVSDGAAVAT